MDIKIQDRIRELYKENGGSITPDIVIEDARNEDSPLHSQFNWDVEEAAKQAWRETARRLIRSVRVKVEFTDITFSGKGRREFIEDPMKGTGNQGYVARAAIKSDREMAVATITREIERIESAIRRAQEVAADIGIDDEIDIITANVVQIKDKLSA